MNVCTASKFEVRSNIDANKILREIEFGADGKVECEGVLNRRRGGGIRNENVSAGNVGPDSRVEPIRSLLIWNSIEEEYFSTKDTDVVPLLLL